MSEHPDTLADARGALRNIIRDPVTSLLLENSQLTETQFETLLADSLSGENQEKKGRRRLYRPGRARVSRGAYNRTLTQAQNNVIRSIYTILLMGYVGLFDTAALQPFLELSDGIKGYVEETRQASPQKAASMPIAIRELRNRLQETVESLAKRSSFKDAA